jgi:cation diffusion facilitator family transporter
MQDLAPIGPCVTRTPLPDRGREKGLIWVATLSGVTMLAEIIVGYASGSMALLADGWHMATHVGALGLAAVAGLLTRRFATHQALAFGTGKVSALAGYTSAIALTLVAVSMLVESFTRLLHVRVIDYDEALPVAVLGLVVNLLSVALLHRGAQPTNAGFISPQQSGTMLSEQAASSRLMAHGHGHGHSPAHCHGHAHGPANRSHHDHNYRAAFLHVAADALTSVFAIFALLGAKSMQLHWLDAFVGVLGAVVILRWSVGLLRETGQELLDGVPSHDIEPRVRRALEALDDVRVADLHVWSLGAGRLSCVVTLTTSEPREPERYREALRDLDLTHLTIEVQRRDDKRKL